MSFDINRKHILIAGAIAAVLLLLLLVRGCGGKGDSVELGPAETAEAFCRALAAGEFARACELCDTVSMKAYIDTYRSVFESFSEENEKAAAIASGILGDMDFSVENMTKEGGRRIVFYTIGLSDGMKRNKVATLMKVEGAWKVETVTDRY